MHTAKDSFYMGHGFLKMSHNLANIIKLVAIGCGCYNIAATFLYSTLNLVKIEMVGLQHIGVMSVVAQIGGQRCDPLVPLSFGAEHGEKKCGFYNFSLILFSHGFCFLGG